MGSTMPKSPVSNAWGARGAVARRRWWGWVVHIVAVLAIYRCSTMAQTGVSGPVVVDGESFLDALFASAGQG